MDKGASPIESGIIIGIASLTLTIFAPVVGYFVSLIQTTIVQIVIVPIHLHVHFSFLNLIGIKFSMITGLVIVGGTYLALGYVSQN